MSPKHNHIWQSRPPGSYYKGERIDQRPGETFGEALLRHQNANAKPTALATQLSAPKPTQLSASDPTPTEQSAPKPIDPKTAPVGSREWAGCLLKEFGQELGVKYIDRGLTYSAALQERHAELTAEHKQLAEAVAKKERKETGFAASIRVAGSEAKADSQSPAAPQKPKGFAAKLKFGSFNAFGGKHPQKSE